MDVITEAVDTVAIGDCCEGDRGRARAKASCGILRRQQRDADNPARRGSGNGRRRARDVAKCRQAHACASFRKCYGISFVQLWQSGDSDGLAACAGVA